MTNGTISIKKTPDGGMKLKTNWGGYLELTAEEICQLKLILIDQFSDPVQLPEYHCQRCIGLGCVACTLAV